MEQNKKAISGIVCDVCNCTYHANDNKCHEECIAVGPSYAQSSSETVCATFKPKDNCEGEGCYSAK